MKTLLIDNYDSYTYNLYQLMTEIHGRKTPLASRDVSKKLEALLRNVFSGYIKNAVGRI